MCSVCAFAMLPEFIWGTQPFQYKPICRSTRKFRVMRLLPPTRSLLRMGSATLHVQLLEVDLDDKSAHSSFDALSYAWTPESRTGRPTRAIVVETASGPRILYIHQNLQQALLSLSSNGIATSRPIFVDQICIHQEDEAEKGHQVSLMRDIYSKCARTLAWLGPATRNSSLWFNFVHEINCEGILSRMIGPRSAQFMTVFDAVMDDSITVAGEDLEDRNDILEMLRRSGDRFPLDGYVDVLDRSWFNRLWVIQEACLASQVLLVCGDQTACFDCFRQGALFYSIYNTHFFRHLSAPQPQAELRKRNSLFSKAVGLTRLIQERKRIHKIGIKRDLYDVLLKYNVKEKNKAIESALPEDRVFGVLGLAADDDDLAKQVRVRYSTGPGNAEVIKIYVETAKILLSRKIDTLLFAQFPKEISSLPSWVPDWTMNLTMPACYSDLDTAVFSAGGPSSDAEFCVSESIGQLRIKGCFIDTIAEVGLCPHRAAPNPQVMEQIDYRHAKLFFDEADKFIDTVAREHSSGGSISTSHDEKDVLRLRLCDGGLSFHHFTAQLGESAGPERLKALHGSISMLGQRLLNTDATVASYSIRRIYRTIGITPWYLIPPPEMDCLRKFAVSPVSAGMVLREAVSDLVTDVVGLVLASCRVSWASTYMRIRRRFGKINFNYEPADLTRLGLDPAVATGPDMAAFTDNMLKNVNRKLYRTNKGHLGLCPPRTLPGDVVVVFHGASVPCVLKQKDKSKLPSEDQVWGYIGEAYCDGHMFGEQMGSDKSAVRWFSLH